MSDDTISKLPIRNKQHKQGLMLVPPPRTTCDHLNAQFEVDFNAGKCKCMTCGGEVSPMFVLQQLMKAESRWQTNLERYQDEMRRLKERSRTKCQFCGKMTGISRR